MVQRYTYRRRHSYATNSNKVKLYHGSVVQSCIARALTKTPGGKLTVHYLKKIAKGPKCAEPGCDQSIQGIAHLRPRKYGALSKRQKTVNRAYGGNRCASCVRDRVIRAFLIEEQKVVKKLLKAQQKK